MISYHTSYISETVGSNASNTFKPVYLNAGTITAVSQTVGANTVNALKPVYANAGTITALSNSSGGTAKPVYVDAGAIKPISATVGSKCQPVYLKDGTITAVDSPNAGNYFDTVPFIRSSGIMDIGKGFDFHNTDTTTASTEGRLILNSTTGDAS